MDKQISENNDDMMSITSGDVLTSKHTRAHKKGKQWSFKLSNN